MNFFNFEVFKLRLTGKRDRNDLLFRLQERIDKNLGVKVGTSSIDSDAKASLLLFLDRDKKKETKLPLLTITPDWLRQYEKWKLDRGISTTTIFIVLAKVRAVFNDAISKGEFDQNKYPFGKGKYEMPTPEKSKRALNEKQLLDFFQYEPKTVQEEYAKDFFILSFLASGMNLGDVFTLKWSEFNAKESLTFLRLKTKNPEKITIYLRLELLVIIDKYGSRKINNDYVFNFLSPEMDVTGQHLVLKMATNKVNVDLKKIGAEIGFDFGLSSYFARISYASKLMKTATIAYISKQLGHSNISTTEIYLGSFSQEESNKYEIDLIPKEELGNWI